MARPLPSPPSHAPAGPRRCESKNSLHCDVQARDVERLEHDLCSVLAVLRRVEWRLRLQDRQRTLSLSATEAAQ